jgi:predicted RNA-binding protein with PIN domain
MNLLVDGHNLIGQLPGISLADADDEAQLVMMLRRYATRKRGRQVVVVFDGGVYGHPQQLDGYGVTCHFAKSPQDADAQLLRRLRALHRPAGWALVSSDRQVARAAEEHGVRVIGAREFAAQLVAPAASPAPSDEKADVRLSEAEIAEWLRLFGEPPDEPPAAPDTANDGVSAEVQAPETGPRKRKRRGRS